MTGALPGRHRGWARRWIPAVGLGAEAILAATLVLTLPTAAPANISGYARCTSGRPVQGVWIEGFRGGSQFAFLTPGDRRAAQVHYTHRLPHGGGYQVRVGCGGHPGDWAETIQSPYVSGPFHDFTCHDIPGTVHFGACRES